MLDLDDVNAANARDVLAAVPDAVALAMGTHPVRNPHPFAELVAESPLRSAAFAAGQILRPRQIGEVEAAVIGRGVRTHEFAAAIAAGVQAAARRKFDVQAQHVAAVSVVEVDRLGEPEPVGALDLSVPFEDVGDGLEYKTSTGALRDGETITLSSLGRLIGVTRESVFNDNLGLIDDALSATGCDAARHEARLVAAALDSAGNLSDGSPVFDAAHGNVTVSGGVLSSATVAEAMMALRLQLAADGEPLDAAAAYLVVSPVLELAARQLVSYGLVGSITVLTLAGLTSGRFYLIASRDVARNIAVARLSGAAHPLAVEPVRVPISYDGAILRVRIDTAAAILGRLGIVRAGA